MFTFELYLRSQRVLVFGAETSDAQQDWTHAIAKVTLTQTHRITLKRFSATSTLQAFGICVRLWLNRNCSVCRTVRYASTLEGHFIVSLSLLCRCALVLFLSEWVYAITPSNRSISLASHPSHTHTHTHSHIFPFKWSVEVLVSRLKCLRNSESSARECSKGVCVCTSICICQFNPTPGLVVVSVWQKTLETYLCDLHKTPDF